MRRAPPVPVAKRHPLYSRLTSPAAYFAKYRRSIAIEAPAAGETNDADAPLFSLPCIALPVTKVTVPSIAGGRRRRLPDEGTGGRLPASWMAYLDAHGRVHVESLHWHGLSVCKPQAGRVIDAVPWRFDAGDAACRYRLPVRGRRRDGGDRFGRGGLA